MPKSARLALVPLLLLTSACGPIEEARLRPLDPGERVRVVATVGMVGDAAARIGGDRVEVETLMGPGIDPHVYKASEGDLRRLERAHVILYGGLHLEAKMADVFARVGGERLTRAVAEAVPQRLLLRPADFEGAYDPHVWFDVDLWAQVVEGIGDELAARDPAGAADYRRNAARTGSRSAACRGSAPSPRPARETSSSSRTSSPSGGSPRSTSRPPSRRARSRRSGRPSARAASRS